MLRRPVVATLVLPGNLEEILLLVEPLEAVDLRREDHTATRELRCVTCVSGDDVALTFRDCVGFLFLGKKLENPGATDSAKSYRVSEQERIMMPQRFRVM